jgi:hypothetical protein
MQRDFITVGESNSQKGLTDELLQAGTQYRMIGRPFPDSAQVNRSDHELVSSSLDNPRNSLAFASSSCQV